MQADQLKKRPEFSSVRLVVNSIPFKVSMSAERHLSKWAGQVFYNKPNERVVIAEILSGIIIIAAVMNADASKQTLIFSDGIQFRCFKDNPRW